MLRLGILAIALLVRPEAILTCQFGYSYQLVKIVKEMDQ